MSPSKTPEYVKAYRIKTAARRQELKKAAYQLNKEKLRQKAAEYRKANPDKCLQLAREYYKNNKATVLAKAKKIKEELQKSTLEGATQNGELWDAVEDSLLITSEMDDHELAEHLGRTYFAVRFRREKLKQKDTEP